MSFLPRRRGGPPTLDRTVDPATDADRQAAVAWTVDMLTAPRRDFGEFTVALAYLPLISSKAALTALEARLADRRAELDKPRPCRGSS